MNGPLVLWCAALATGAAWGAVNIVLLFGCIGALARGAAALRIVLWGAVKFVIWYAAGYAVLAARVFPVSGLLTGLTVALIATGVYALWTQRKP